MKRPSVFSAIAASLFALACNAVGQTSEAAAAAAASAAAPAPATAVVTSTVPSNQNYQPRFNYQTYFADYLTLMRGKPVDLIFIGDSITEQWRWGPGSPVWKKRFEGRALNFGLGSDRTQHTIWRLQNIDLKGWSPKVAVILIGTNNVGDTPEDIAAGVLAVVEATKTTFPGIKIVLVSILPNARATEKMAAANRFIAQFADEKSVFYFDLAAKFPPTGDGNWVGLTRDKLHLSTEGYEVWANELEALLPRVLGKP
ncbi:MAG TPA: GDSL-type esterase/lipase family protein [Opitutaceae bacterium]|nr:GDSL-type esterase/lipase family protein [Opitutaceae bacterium]